MGKFVTDVMSKAATHIYRSGQRIMSNRQGLRLFKLILRPTLDAFF